MTEKRMGLRKIAAGIDFGVRSDSLVVNEISRWFGVEPTCAFEKGDSYTGREKRGPSIVAVNRVRPFGVWHFCTSESLHSNNVNDHARLLIDTFTPAKSAIAQMIADPELYVKITIWVLGYTFDISAVCLASLSSFAEDVTITCWDEKEDYSK